MNNLIQSDTQVPYNLIPSKLSHFFTITVMGSGSSRVSVLTFSENKSKQIEDYIVIPGNNYHRQANLFIEKCLNKLIKGTKNIKNQHLKILIPFHLANKGLINVALSKYNIDLVGYKVADLLLDESIKRIKNGILKLKSLGDVTESSVKKLIDNLNSIHKKYCIPVHKGLSFKLNYTQQRMKFSTRGRAWGINMLTLNENSLPKENNSGQRYMQFVSYNDFKKHTSGIVGAKFDDFWDKYLAPKFVANKNAKIGLQFRVGFTNGSVRSFSAIDVVCSEDQVKMKKIYMDIDKIKSEYYSLNQSGPIIDTILFGYRILKDDTPTCYPSGIEHLKKIQRKLDNLSITAIVPNNMKTSLWGPTVDIGGETYIAINNSIFAKIKKIIEGNIVHLYTKALGTLAIAAVFKDLRGAKNVRDLTTFRRFYKGKILYFEKGKLTLITKILWYTKFIPKSIEKIKAPNQKIITMDFETKEIVNIDLNKNRDRKMEVVCASIYVNGMSKILNFKIWEYSSSQELVESVIKTLLKTKYSGYTVYLHNMGRFDSVFFMGALVSIPDIKINLIRRDGILISINIQYNKSVRGNNTVYKCSINIWDSLNILPLSLDKLGKCFGSENKGIFPLKVLNDPNISLDYEGDVPDLKYFYQPSELNRTAYKIFHAKYLEYINPFVNGGIKWNLKLELLKYCEQDVITLNNVILKFSKLIFDKFGVNILKHPTLPSIAFKIYRSKFMSNLYIPIITGNVYKDIKQAYYGGIVDVYKSFAMKIASYDVNSLYPFSMLSNPMPTGAPVHFEYPEYKPLDSIFGFVYAKIKAPLNLYTPILPFRLVRENNSFGGTIFPTGTFEGWYFTEELKNAEKYGYEIEVIRGYKFKKAYLFIDYVNTLYSIKKSVTSDNPLYTISKLLMNSLYGRFGMDPLLPKTIILNSKEEIDNLTSDCVVHDVENVGDKYLVTYLKKDATVLPSTYVSIPVAAAIASYSRIHMSQFMIKYSNVICAIDTDGIKITSELDSKYVGTELGLMKREYELKEGCFIAPKVYGGITSSDKMIVKAKGVKGSLSYWYLKSLLWGEALKIDQQKWYRDYENSTIYIKDELYSLAPTENKRQIIWDSCGYFVGTVPFELENGIVVKRKPPLLHYLPAPTKLLCLPAPEEFLYISAPDSYLALKAPREEENNNYILPTVFYMGPPLPSVIYLGGKIKNRGPAHAISVDILDLETGIYTTFNSIRSAASYIGIDHKTLLDREKNQIAKGINTLYRKRYIIYIKRSD